MSNRSEKATPLGVGGHHRARPSNWLTMVLLAGLVLWPGGCMVQTRVINNPWDQLLADSNTTPTQSANQKNQSQGTTWTQAAQQDNDPHNIAPFAGFYSLQIAYYDDQFNGDRHSAAEQAARVLRQEGEEAYYYHGPNRSMVTIGLLTHEAAFVTEENPLAPGSLIERWAPAVRALQKQHPYNLGNGLTLIEKIDGKKIGEQPSSLVQIPTNPR